MILSVILTFVIVGQGIIIYYILNLKNREKKFSESDIGKKLELLRSFWGPFVIYVVATSVIGLFIVSFCTEKSITIEIINTWVSLILGMVALVIGVISLFLSFYNVDQSVQAFKENKMDIEKMQEKYKKEMEDLKCSIEKKIEDSSDRTIKAVQGNYLKRENEVKINYDMGEEKWE